MTAKSLPYEALAEAAVAASVGTPTLTKIKVCGLMAAIALAGAMLPALGASTLALTLLTQAVIYAVLATSVGFMIRQNGLVSFGHAAFFGLAAYLMALSMARHWASMETTILVAIALMALLAFLLGLLFIRLVGVAFSQMTLAVAQGCYEVFLRWRELANGEDGTKVALPANVFGLDVSVFQQPASMFVLCWIVLMLVLAALWLVMHSQFGTLTLAIRENEERARFIGYGTTLPRAIIYAISGAVAALAGVLFALYNAFVTPEVLHWGLSGEVLIMAVIGGTRSVWGPAVGAILFFLLKGALGDVTEHWAGIMGTLLIVVVVLAPVGLSGICKAAFQRFLGRAA